MSTDRNLLATTGSICARNSKYIGGLLDVLGKLPNLSTTNVLLKNLLLISEEMLDKDPDSVDFVPNVHSTPSNIRTW